jgi:type III secretion protein T
MTAYEQFSQVVLSFFLGVPRVAAALLILPMMTAETVPTMARNSIFLGVSLVTIPLAMQSVPLITIELDWPFLLFKEVFLGLLLGFMFGVTFWAVAAAGELIDNKVGTASASIMDPLTGHQTSLTAGFFSRLVAWIFIASGGFLLFFELVFSSYVIWPITASFPAVTARATDLVISGVAGMMALALAVAAPILILLTVIDVAFGLVNRFAPSLNAFNISMPVKAWVSQLLLLLMLGVIAEFVLRKLLSTSVVLEALQRVL